ncbi:Rho GTPase-activating protein 1 [Collichthys lucidus]|uniref:Rho GTPase-activating protein 1 n=1 Tax=Collichthys lucidus TaxID=240159 RepID=A0A4U5VPE3_COLLU|nr:Rho GTPase-activating protein 1 [Collichthys lucidus]
MTTPRRINDDQVRILYFLIMSQSSQLRETSSSNTSSAHPKNWIIPGFEDSNPPSFLLLSGVDPPPCWCSWSTAQKHVLIGTGRAGEFTWSCCIQNVIKTLKITMENQLRSTVTPDLSHPYYDVARHGIVQVSGDDNYGRKLIIFSSCCLPPSHQLNHRRLLEYLKFTLDQYVEMDYILVYFHHGLRSNNKPSLKWLREAYDDHKFGKKLTYVNYLAELRAHLNYEQLLVPADVLRHDEKLRAARTDGAPPSVKTPPPRPPLPTQQFGVSLQ